jgi:hypothetical protein
MVLSAAFGLDHIFMATASKPALHGRQGPYILAGSRDGIPQLPAAHPRAAQRYQRAQDQLHELRLLQLQGGVHQGGAHVLNSCYCSSISTFSAPPYLQLLTHGEAVVHVGPSEACQACEIRCCCIHLHANARQQRVSGHAHKTGIEPGAGTVTAASDKPARLSVSSFTQIQVT